MSAALDLSLIGCSDLPVIAGVSRYSSPIDLWNRVVHGLQPKLPEWVTAAGELGTLYEEGTAIYLVERVLRGHRADLTKPPSRPRPAGVPWLRYSLDFAYGVRRRADGTWDASGDPQHIIECKVRNWRSFAEQDWGRPGTDDVALDVMVQVQGQLACLHLDRDYWLGTDIPDLDVVHVAVSLDGQEVRHYPVRRIPDVGEGLLEAASKWWRDHVVSGLPPPIDGSEGYRNHLERLYPQASKQLREATAEEVELAAQYRAIKAEVKALEERKARLENLLCAHIGTDAGIKLPEGGKVRWSERKGYTQWKGVAEALALRLGLQDAELDGMAEFHRGAPSRSFDFRW